MIESLIISSYLSNDVSISGWPLIKVSLNIFFIILIRSLFTLSILGVSIDVKVIRTRVLLFIIRWYVKWYSKFGSTFVSSFFSNVSIVTFSDLYNLPWNRLCSWDSMRAFFYMIKKKNIHGWLTNINQENSIPSSWVSCME